jgi:hypothetical protein
MVDLEDPELDRLLTWWCNEGRASYPGKSLQEAMKSLPSPQRNDPCDCGSGKKWKKCCGRMYNNVGFKKGEK